AFQQLFHKMNLHGGYPQGSQSFRRAWARFIKLGEQIWEPLIPGSTVRREQWHPAGMGRTVHEIKDKAAHIVERGGIRQVEAEPFRKGVAALLDEALKVIACMRRVLASHPVISETPESVPLPDVHKLLQGQRPATPEEEMCLEVLRGILAGNSATSAG